MLYHRQAWSKRIILKHQCGSTIKFDFTLLCFLLFSPLYSSWYFTVLMLYEGKLSLPTRSTVYLCKMTVILLFVGGAGVVMMIGIIITNLPFYGVRSGVTCSADSSLFWCVSLVMRLFLLDVSLLLDPFAGC